MIAVLVLSGPSPSMHGLDSERSPSLLPLGDRPALQHVIESLVTQGITQIELVVAHAPERVEHLLGNGDRWGCRFRYHLPAQAECPYRSLKVISELASEPWLIVHAERFPCDEFRAPKHGPKLFFGEFRTGEEELTARMWGGAVAMPPGEIDDSFAAFTFDDLEMHLLAQLARGDAEAVDLAEWLDVSTAAALLASQAALLDKKLPGLMINAPERQPGFWVSRNVTLHSTAEIQPPVYIGPNSRIGRNARLGPHAVIGADCIVDAKTVVTNALVTDGSYVGEALEVDTAIVCQNLLVNVRLDASVDVGEAFLIGKLEASDRRGRISHGFQAVLSLLLFVVMLPVLLIALVCYAVFGRKSATSVEVVCLPVLERTPAGMPHFLLPCIGGDAWAVHRPAGWSTFLRQLLPGLLAILAGKLHLVGLPPRTEAQVRALHEDWRVLYLNGRAGLITEASLACGKDADEMQLYLADAYYTIQRGTKHDIQLLLKYFGRLLRFQ